MKEAPRILLIGSLPSELVSGLESAGMIVRADESLDASAIAEWRAHVVVFHLANQADLSSLRNLKVHQPNLPTLVVSDPPPDAESSWSTAVLDAGANDCVPSAMPWRELQARIQAQLRIHACVEDLGRKERNAELLLEISQALTSSLDIHDILYTVVRRVAEVVDACRASIVLAPDPESSDAAYVMVASDDAKLHNLRLDLSKYPEIRQVLRTKEPLTIQDAQSHPLLDGVRGDLSSVGSVSVFPIAWRSQALGVLFLRSAAEKRSMNEKNAHFCRIITNATAVALRNARVMQQLRDQSQQVAFERFEAERRLRSLKRYADLFASAAEGIAVIDASGHLLFANPRAYEITRETEVSMAGRKIRDLIHPDDEDLARQIWSSFDTAGYPRAIDLRVQRSDGKRITCAFSFAPLADGDGAVLLTFQDVTEHREIQAELDRTRVFLESLIDASVDGIVAADMKGKIILFNKGAERIYGYSAEQMRGELNVRQLYPGDGARRVMRMLLSEEHGGEGKLSPVEIEVMNAQGELVPVLLSAAVIYTQGEPTATFGIFTDQRERRQVEQRLAVAQQKLAKSEKQALIAELAGATAHELNQPLTSIMAYSESLKRRFQDGTPEHRAATILLSEAERMADIVRKIGRITRYETTAYVGEQRILDLDKSSET